MVSMDPVTPLGVTCHALRLSKAAFKLVLGAKTVRIVDSITYGRRVLLDGVGGEGKIP